MQLFFLTFCALGDPTCDRDELLAQATQERAVENN